MLMNFKAVGKEGASGLKQHLHITILQVQWISLLNTFNALSSLNNYSSILEDICVTLVV